MKKVYKFELKAVTQKRVKTMTAMLTARFKKHCRDRAAFNRCERE